MNNTGGTPLKILVVDDDMSLRGIIVNNIRKAGYETAAAADGEEGLSVAREIHPDIIVSDIMMPKMDGVEMLKHVRESESLKDSYVLMLTAKDRTVDMLEGFAATADDYLTKPFKIAELIARVNAGARLKSMQNQLREANEKLRLSLTQLARLFGVAAHDLRNPINIVTTYISLLGQDIVAPEEIKDVCLRRSTEMVGLIDNLLDITKIDAGMIELTPSEVNVTNVLNETISLFEPVARQKKVMLEAACPSEFRIFCDRGRLLEMFNTLLHESIRLSPANRKVHAVLECIGGEAVFSVTTDGGGFGEEEATRIFKTPVHASTIPEGYDTSAMLGFAIVKKIATLMGGSVFADSGGDRQGATFGFTLPCPAGDTLEEANRRFAEAAGKSNIFPSAR